MHRTVGAQGHRHAQQHRFLRGRHHDPVQHVVADDLELEPSRSERTPEGDVTLCALTGDSLTDVRAAHKAGAAAIGYANKPHKHQAVTEDMQAIADAIQVAAVERLSPSSTGAVTGFSTSSSTRARRGPAPGAAHEGGRGEDMPPAGALRLRDGGGAAGGCRPSVAGAGSWGRWWAAAGGITTHEGWERT